MLDFRFIKDNLEAVKANVINRNMKADVDLVVKLFDDRTRLVTELQDMQAKKNTNAAAMKGKLPQEERDKLIEEGRKIKEEINTYRPHKQFDMITMKGYTNINEVLKYNIDYVHPEYFAQTRIYSVYNT